MEHPNLKQQRRCRPNTISESQIFLLEPLCELPRQVWKFLNSRTIVTTVPVLKDYLLTRVFINPGGR